VAPTKSGQTAFRYPNIQLSYAQRCGQVRVHIVEKISSCFERFPRLSPNTGSMLLVLGMCSVRKSEGTSRHNAPIKKFLNKTPLTSESGPENTQAWRALLSDNLILYCSILYYTILLCAFYILPNPSATTPNFGTQKMDPTKRVREAP
jgi:hypothetical protein